MTLIWSSKNWIKIMVNIIKHILLSTIKIASTKKKDVQIKKISFYSKQIYLLKQKRSSDFKDFDIKRSFFNLSKNI